jgi:hypothetical protein
MTESEEEPRSNWIEITGAAIVLALIVALVVLVPGLYLKLWEWVY